MKVKRIGTFAFDIHDRDAVVHRFVFNLAGRKYNQVTLTELLAERIYAIESLRNIEPATIALLFHSL